MNKRGKVLALALLYFDQQLVAFLCDCVHSTCLIFDLVCSIAPNTFLERCLITCLFLLVQISTALDHFLFIPYFICLWLRFIIYTGWCSYRGAISNVSPWWAMQCSSEQHLGSNCNWKRDSSSPCCEKKESFLWALNKRLANSQTEGIVQKYSQILSRNKTELPGSLPSICLSRIIVELRK